MKRLRRGEYDLVNISLIGRDPITGRSYEECHDEWRAEVERVKNYEARLRWWNLIGRAKVRWQTWVLVERLGMPY